jgi:hypothetical protein
LWMYIELRHRLRASTRTTSDRECVRSVPMSSSGYPSTAALDLEEEVARRSIERERKLKEQLESLEIRFKVQGYILRWQGNNMLPFHVCHVQQSPLPSPPLSSSPPSPPPPPPPPLLSYDILYYTHTSSSSPLLRPPLLLFTQHNTTHGRRRPAETIAFRERAAGAISQGCESGGGKTRQATHRPRIRGPPTKTARPAHIAVQ